MISNVLASRRGIGFIGQAVGGAAAESWWLSGGISAANAIAVYQPIGAASLAASYSNLANPGTYDAAPGVAPTWASGTGWTFNGATQYLTTGVVPASLAWGAIVRFSGVITGTYQFALGSRTSLGGAFGIELIEKFPDRNVFYNGGSLFLADAIYDGVLAFSGPTAYRDGANVGTIPTGTVTTLPVFVGTYNNYGSPLFYVNGNIQAVAIYNTTLTADQVAAVSTAMAALTG